MRRLPLRMHSAVLCLALLGVPAAIAGCGKVGNAPSPTPADFGGVAIRLSAQGVSPHDIVSGDPGCSDATLAPTAVSFTASGLDQASPVRLHVYIFKDGDTLTRLRPEVDLCARSYVTDPATYESLDVSPYVVAGQGPWGSAFKNALQTGLMRAAQFGG